VHPNGNNFRRVARLDIVDRMRRLVNQNLYDRPRWLSTCEEIPPLESKNFEIQDKVVRNPYPTMVKNVLKRYPDLRFHDPLLEGNDWQAGKDSYRPDHPVMRFVAAQKHIMNERSVSKQEAFRIVEEQFLRERLAQEERQKIRMALFNKSMSDVFSSSGATGAPGVQPLFATGAAVHEKACADLEVRKLQEIRREIQRERERAERRNAAYGAYDTLSQHGAYNDDEDEGLGSTSTPVAQPRRGKRIEVLRLTRDMRDRRAAADAAADAASSSTSTTTPSSSSTRTPVYPRLTKFTSTPVEPELGEKQHAVRNGTIDVPAVEREREDAKRAAEEVEDEFDTDDDEPGGSNESLYMDQSWTMGGRRSATESFEPRASPQQPQGTHRAASEPSSSSTIGSKGGRFDSTVTKREEASTLNRETVDPKSATQEQQQGSKTGGTAIEGLRSGSTVRKTSTPVTGPRRTESGDQKGRWKKDDEE